VRAVVVHVIEVLGPGCTRCERTTAEIRAVVHERGVDADIRHVTDPFEIVARGVLFSIPVVLVDGVVVSTGRVPTRRDRAMARRLIAGEAVRLPKS